MAPQLFVMVVLHALPQPGAGQVHWLPTHVWPATEHVPHWAVVPHAVTEPQPSPAQLGGVQHAPW